MEGEPVGDHVERCVGQLFEHVSSLQVALAERRWPKSQPVRHSVIGEWIVQPLCDLMAQPENVHDPWISRYTWRKPGLVDEGMHRRGPVAVDGADLRALRPGGSVES